MEAVLKETERIDDLQFKGLRIIQNEQKFCFGTDAVLLSHFVGLKKGDSVVDLGTGTGIIPILLAGRMTQICITGIEIQEDMVQMARRSLVLNGLSDRVSILHGDIRHCADILGKGKHHLVISNPPYMKAGSGLVNPKDDMAIARHEVLCTLGDILDVASKLLVQGGRFAMIHRPERLVDILAGMRQRKIEPKRIQLIHPSFGKAPNLVLVDGMLHGRPSLLWLPPLYVYNEAGEYTDALRRIYHLDAVLKDSPLEEDNTIE